MKGSLFLAATGAALAMAGPIGAPLNKRAMATDWVVEVVTVTVTDGNDRGAAFIEQATPDPIPTPTPIPEPEPEPTPVEPVPEPEPTTTTSEGLPIPTFEPEPEPEPSSTTVEPAPSPSPEPGDPSLGEYETTMLEQHNLHRANHSADALTWDSDLAQWAENTAQGCVFEHDMNQGDGQYGQNLASWGGTGDISGDMIKTAASGVTNQWYNGEVNAYTYFGSNPPDDADFMAWGHFTQVVWKSTTQVGCATVQCDAGTVLSYESWYTVCNYKSAGNFGGQYIDNVLESIGDETVTV